MAEITLVMKRVFQKGLICFEVPADATLQHSLKNVLTACQAKHKDYALVTIQTPKRRRTTGYKSQNHHLNGHIVQICNVTGNSYGVIKDYIKLTAVEQLEYPYEIFNGKLIPKPESDSTTEECTKLIEAAHYVAAELGIVLRED